VLEPGQQRPLALEALDHHAGVAEGAAQQGPAAASSRSERSGQRGATRGRIALAVRSAAIAAACA
jgi:hypothetical protein